MNIGKTQVTKIHGVFNIDKYYKNKNIYGNLKSNKIELVEHKKSMKKLNYLIENKFEKSFDTKTSSYLSAIILGNKNKLTEETKDNFTESGLSHILAISGMHISIILLISEKLLEIFLQNSKLKKTILILILILYGMIIDLSSSSARSNIMAVLFLISRLIYKKDNFFVNISISSLVILIANPYSLLDTGFQLSFLATIGIVSSIKHFPKIEIDNKLLKYAISSLFVSLSANLFILPIIIISFKKISLSMFVIQILITPFVYVIEILGLISMFLPVEILKTISPILKLIINLFDNISKINFFKIYIKVPNKITIVIYYLVVIIIIIKPRKFIKNIIKYVLIFMIIISIITFSITSTKNELKIYMIDVGQGDSTLLITPKNQTILIDGGGNEEYDIGKNVLMPYLLNKKIDKLDYIIISHFDSDHSSGLNYIIENFKVENIIIGKQFEICENYKEFINLVNKKNTKIYIVEAGQKIKIEKDLYFDILWPDTNNAINSSSINNNSLVCKLVYKKFSMLFTGDIEEKSEKAILRKYNNNLNILNSMALKVAHHGSKTSTSKAFLEKVNPQYALIGVGENNKFGHPSNITIENLANIYCKIYRTDEDGEITLRITSKGRTHIKGNEFNTFNMN